jgi:hypothetical protein
MTSAMEQEITDAAEETLLQNLQRRYAYLAAWLVRFNRAPEPARLPEPVRLVAAPRVPVPPRQPHPPRPA